MSTRPRRARLAAREQRLPGRRRAPDGRPRAGAGAAPATRTRSPTARGWRAGSRWPTWPTPSRSSRAARSAATTPAACSTGCSSSTRSRADDFPWRPELGDAFNSREHELKARVGASAAGWLSAGRPRREAFRVALRLVARDGALDLHDAHARPGRARSSTWPSRHAGDLAADYTYLQPAQPTTIGHLLLAYAYPALRDADAPARRARLARPERRRGRAAAPARAGRSTASAWPSCSAAPG